MYIPEASERIKQYLPDLKIIAILRNPIDGAFSKFLQLKRDGSEPILSFEKAIEAEEARIKNNWSPTWHYLHRGLYYNQLMPYYSKFRKGQIKIFLYEDLLLNPIGLIQDIFRFLDVDDNFLPDISEKVNVSKILSIEVHSDFFHLAMHKPNPIRNLLKSILSDKQSKKISNALHKINVKSSKEIQIQPMSDEFREQLINYFTEDIRNLQSLINRDLTHWLKI